MIYYTGKSGQLGWELTKRFKSLDLESIGFSREEWDLTDLDSVEKILKDSPKILVHCGAYTAVDKAESDSENVYKINSLSVKKISEECLKRKIHLIYISTDFVFDANSGTIGDTIRFWKPDSTLSPKGIYGLSKAEGEKWIRKIFADSKQANIVRTSWVYSSYGNNFPKTILKLLQDPKRTELKVIEDQLGRPTWAGRLADFIIFLIYEILKGRGYPEILHFSNSGIASWYDFAIAIRDISHSFSLIENLKPISPIPTESYPTAAPRPRYSILDLNETRKIFGPVPHWKEDLTLCLKEIAEISGKKV
ncbi:dTDP-4-dehydrorhamnose reductase [Leptospira borgpetersenii]|uniref:dTDP-4-dehydrorhamnose reductase n=1 Tax=Leptospira borgpetersenii serovar Ballum TaxID=280505 RepID=A0A0E3BPV7_LEPBO|nr:dTDP-4-dehydrorhamnose reductase [Leptospira borgpetersenii]EMO11510.1 dTDP-4-dehydrorhamnose reductase [Leptospira borgpetersenii str. Noumea 25]ALO25978.1 dTDP-4-dehydrorhamnose reductase [Leptospira borgpetersenii serovar Ballum]ANH00748.2 dTDP-4-dehydrorhamnose reductase [Leptospira borgpetersenii str. 4E]EKR00422.1 dTDP-4-dehydrorhamnose reductase [Leptospira borgpetersenii serovar Castellonis str. 200801910]KGE24414.1 dTDP-4-dehydrorhamnose reductase [Leptospira borgpetersenii serovar